MSRNFTLSGTRRRCDNISTDTDASLAYYVLKMTVQ